MEEKELKKNDVEGIQVTVVPVTEEEIAEKIRNGDYEWTEYDGDDTAHQYDDLTPEELEEKMEKNFLEMRRTDCPMKSQKEND